MKYEWKNNREPASDSEVDEFEKKHHIRFSQEHRLFLTSIVNGGMPIGITPVPTTGCPGGAGDLHGVYGVNNPADYWDLAKAFEYRGGRLPLLIPFGYDEGNGPLFIDMFNKPGGLVYSPWDEFAGNENFPTYHVAGSIAEFFEISARMAEELLEGGL